jgi:hypothetical protein
VVSKTITLLRYVKVLNTHPVDTHDLYVGAVEQDRYVDTVSNTEYFLFIFFILRATRLSVSSWILSCVYPL